MKRAATRHIEESLAQRVFAIPELAQHTLFQLEDIVDVVQACSSHPHFRGFCHDVTFWIQWIGYVFGDASQRGASTRPALGFDQYVRMLYASQYIPALEQALNTQNIVSRLVFSGLVHERARVVTDLLKLDVVPDFNLLLPEAETPFTDGETHGEFKVYLTDVLRNLGMAALGHIPSVAQLNRVALLLQRIVWAGYIDTLEFWRAWMTKGVLKSYRVDDLTSLFDILATRPIAALFESEALFKDLFVLSWYLDYKPDEFDTWKDFLFYSRDYTEETLHGTTVRYLTLEPGLTLVSVLSPRKLDASGEAIQEGRVGRHIEYAIETLRSGADIRARFHNNPNYGFDHRLVIDTKTDALVVIFHHPGEDLDDHETDVLTRYLVDLIQDVLEAPDEVFDDDEIDDSFLMG